jgi:uncharacterized protein YjbI with pentapeptide repeats
MSTISADSNMDLDNEMSPKYANTPYFTTKKFNEPGDCIYCGYWRYNILKDGAIQCVNSPNKRKKMVQLVLHANTAPLRYINGKPVSNFFSSFYHAEGLRYISLSGLNLSHVRSFGRMFEGCLMLKAVDMSGLDLSGVTDYRHMFDNCPTLKLVDFSGCDMSGAVHLDSMFYNCASIVELTLNGLTGKSIKSMSYMFRSCKSLRILDLPNLLIDESVEMIKTFFGANKFVNVTCPSAIVIESSLKPDCDEDACSDSLYPEPTVY